MSDFLRDGLKSPTLGDLTGSTLDRTNSNLSAAGYPPISQQEFELYRRIQSNNTPDTIPDELFAPDSSTNPGTGPILRSALGNPATQIPPEAAAQNPTQSPQQPATQQAAVQQTESRGITGFLYDKVRSFFDASWESKFATVLAVGTMGVVTPVIWGLVSGAAVNTAKVALAATAMGAKLGALALNPWVLGIAAVGAVGYFGYNYFKNKE